MNIVGLRPTKPVTDRREFFVYVNQPDKLSLNNNVTRREK